MNPINEYLLRITGSFPVQELDPSKNLTLTKCELAVYEVSKRDNQDGTFNVVYKSKPISFVEYEQDKKAVRGKDKSKKSVRLRLTMMNHADQLGLDREEYYTQYMEKLIHNYEEIHDHLKDL